MSRFSYFRDSVLRSIEEGRTVNDDELVRYLKEQTLPLPVEVQRYLVKLAIEKRKRGRRSELTLGMRRFRAAAVKEYSLCLGAAKKGNFKSPASKALNRASKTFCVSPRTLQNWIRDAAK